MSFVSTCSRSVACITGEIDLSATLVEKPPTSEVLGRSICQLKRHARYLYAWCVPPAETSWYSGLFEVLFITQRSEDNIADKGWFSRLEDVNA